MALNRDKFLHSYQDYRTYLCLAPICILCVCTYVPKYNIHLAQKQLQYSLAFMVTREDNQNFADITIFTTLA